MTDKTTTPQEITTFVSSAIQDLSELDAALSQATSEADKKKEEVDARIAELTRELSSEHTAALDAVATARQAYNDRLAEILNHKIITPDALANLGFKKSGARRGRPAK
jgi:DNA-binding transcriptional MerR regulator